MTLSGPMKHVLHYLKGGVQADVAEMGAKVRTIEALENRGLVQPVYQGGFLFGRHICAWEITDAGRQALND